MSVFEGYHMAAQHNIQFAKECTFDSVFDSHNLYGRAICEMAYLRMDYSGGRWWTSYFSVHHEKETPERKRELSEVGLALAEMFPSLSALENFCVMNAEDLRNGQEYNLYVSGTELNYWLRINVRGDYHVYIHALTKKQGE